MDTHINGLARGNMAGRATTRTEFASGCPFPQSEVISCGRFFATVFATAFVFVSSVPARADDGDAKSILDKAIKALGGEEKLSKAEAFSWKAKGTVNFNGNANESTAEVTVKGLDHFRREFGSDQCHSLVVLAGDKGWRKFGDDLSDLESDRVANEKRPRLPPGHPDHARRSQG